MKKRLLILSSLFIGLTGLNAQSIELSDNSSGGVIANNDVIIDQVTTGNQSHIYIGVKNISSTQKTFGLTRTDVVLNNGGDAYFCFGGTCYGTNVVTSPTFETVAAGSQSPPAQLYYDENNTAGYSEIKYKIYDVNNVNDAVTFTVKINPLLTSVKNNSSLFTSVSAVYPNPAISKASIVINANTTANNCFVSITNALGEIVSTKQINLIAGKNTVAIDSENLTSGIYFATIFSDNHKVVKKFTVNK
jgi:hypothetical protein